MADCQDSLATEEAGGAGGQLQRHAGDQGARQVSLKGQAGNQGTRQVSLKEQFEKNLCSLQVLIRKQ